ncbi:hypothetical protein [Legionella sp. PC997]|uniref:hypothetical protein n=1 Tax=Legionella sp. PC997 TaxID=2755562 RepID=UPI0015FDC102|nr:hypothetical protein [Legionella sp. PC997]QMT60300.1 hypothetical protein HBNCFIEN_01672 [Legionella sp. PC997]
MAYEKLTKDFEDYSLVYITNVITDFNSPPICYKFEINLSPELVSTITPSQKNELFEKMFAMIKEYIKSVQNCDIPLNISELSALKDLIIDNPINTKKLFFYLTDSALIDYIITAENLPALRELFPRNASLQKLSLAEIKESILAEKQFYARASVRGLFAPKKELPYELAEKIGNYLDIRTANAVAQTSMDAAKQAKDALDAEDDDNAALKKFI